MTTPPSEFLAAARSMGLEFEPGDLERLGAYLDRLLEANTRFNLTAITDPSQAWRRHVLDSLTLLPFIVDANAASVADVGSGGGLPGLPLACVMPDVHFTLFEATGKKARFLDETANVLGLSNVEVVNQRAEIVGQDHHHFRERFDVVTARAVGPLPVLLELTVPLARVGGLVLAMKGARADEEITQSKQALHRLHAAVAGVHPTPTGVIIAIEKQRPTPRIYPRQPGEPKRHPLN